MPLVIISGLPCSGKTSHAELLAQYLREHSNLPVEVLSIESAANQRRSQIYETSTTEKKARGAYISLIQRRLSPTRIIIADSLNYIKGYRYQLYCIAREKGTTHCCLYCVLPERLGRQRNEGRSPSEAYSSQMFDELVMRFEEPNNQARWDSPLFTVGEELEGNEGVWSDILKALQAGAIRPPSMATAPKVSASNSVLLLQLDKITGVVCGEIMAQLRVLKTPCKVIVEGNEFMISGAVGMADLQRLRRQFIHMNRLHQVDQDNVASMFISYLQDHLFTSSS